MQTSTHKTSHDIMRERLLRPVTSEIEKPKPKPSISMDEMAVMQWDEPQWQKVLNYMKNRMIMGGYRYGPTDQQKPREFNNPADIIRRVNKYIETGNMEHLVDAANICIIECKKKSHPNFHFESIDDGEHAKKLK